MINYSFIIPHHNAPDLLCRCLDSIPLREDIEIIVVDDNSDFNKRPQITRPDVKLVYIDAEHSKGAGRARNCGMEKAHGKWLLFADCDDYYEQGFVSELDKYKNSNFEIVFFDAYMYYDINSKLCGNNHYESVINNFLDNSSSSYWKKMLKHANNATWLRMYAHEYIKRIGVRYDEIPACNDGWFVQFASANTNKVTAIPKKLYYYVKTKGSITNSRQNRSTELKRLQAQMKIHHLLAKNGAYFAIPPFFHGVKKQIKRNGLFFAIYILIRKLLFDVSPLKILYYKHICSYDK